MTRPVFGDPAAIAAVRDARKPEWVRAMRNRIVCRKGAACPGTVACVGYDAENDRAGWRCTCGALWQTARTGEVVA